jgi:Mg2+ and Co2+ transporter CorA
MSLNLVPHRGSSLEDIYEEGTDDGIEYGVSSRVSSSSHGMSSPLSWRTHRRQRQSGALSSRLNSMDECPELEMAAATVEGDWEYTRADINMPPHFTMADVDLSPRGLEKKMRDLLSDSHYWIKLVERLGYDRRVYDSESAPSLDTLSRYYDSSDLGLLRVFHLFDSDKDRLMSRGEMVRGLVQQGLGINTNLEVLEEAIDELFNLVASPDGPERTVSPLEFLHALKSLRLAAVLYPFSLLTESRRNIVASREMDIHFHEYSEDTLVSLRPVSNPIEFLFQLEEIPTSSRTRVQWIHCHEPSKRTILAIAVQFGLDPRYVMDIFTLWREQAKADLVRDMRDILLPRFHINSCESIEWVFILLPIIRLTAKSRQALEPHFEWRRAQKVKKNKSVPPPDIFIDIESSNLAIFVTGENSRGTDITFTSEWCGLFRLEVKWDDMPARDDDDSSNSARESVRRYHSANLTALDSELSFEPTPAGIPPSRPAAGVTLDIADADLDMFDRVLKVLETSYSHLRTGDAFTLALKTISDICDDYVKIVDAYDAAIEILERKLSAKKDGLSERDLAHIQRSGRHLAKLYRMIRPVTAIIDILSLQKHWGGESTLYISDIKSNVGKALSDSIALAEATENMRTQYQKYGKARTGSVLYLLTLITTLFIPLTFINGVYGMNFASPPDYGFSMPELQLKYGYAFYWVLVLISVGIVFTFYRKKGLI